MKILVAETKDFSAETIAELNQLGELHLKDISADELSLTLDTYDVFWFRLGFQLNRKLILGAKRCKVIVCPVTGLDHIDLAACQEKNIAVLSLNGEIDFLKKVRATAEHTLGLCLSLLRKSAYAIADTKNGTWNRDLYKGYEVYEKKVGILGVGRLGSITAGFFETLGADVYGYDIKPFDPRLCKPVPTIEDLFITSDIISIHVNMNVSTYHLIRYDLLKLMPRNSFLINTSRGSIVKSEDLIRAIEDGILAGAAVDVIENEFNHREDPLIQFAAADPRLIITPHIGGNTWESFEKTEYFVFKKLLEKIDSL